MSPHTSAALLQVKGVTELCLPGRPPGEMYDLFCQATLGIQKKRTRVMNITNRPRWDEVSSIKQQWWCCCCCCCCWW
jgi:hypothetical protein